MVKYTKTESSIQSGNKSYVAVFGTNEFEHLQIILWGWFRNLEMQVINHGSIPRLIGALGRGPFIGKYLQRSIKQHKIYLGHYKGLWFELHKEAVDATIEFYNKVIKNNNKIVRYYNSIFNTKKFEAYLKKEISEHILLLLKHLHLIRLSPHLMESRILINRTPISIFVVEYIEKKYGINYKINWIRSRWDVFYLFIYYAWLIFEVLKRGVIFNKKIESYKLAQEVCWGFRERTLRNDMFIDNVRFKPKDMLILAWGLYVNDPERKAAFKEAESRGFGTVFVPKLKINVTKNILNVLFFYVLFPLKVYIKLFLSSQMYLLYFIFLFHKRCLTTEILMNLYCIKSHISTKDWGDIEETIILNKYGTKNILFHWSDLTNYKTNHFAFIAHNICYTWGDIHYAPYLNSYFVDKRINIGCIYKKGFNKAMNNREDIIARIDGFKKERKTAAFFDASYSNSIEFTELFFIQFLGIVKDFCEANKHINVLLKPKKSEQETTELLQENFGKVKKIKGELLGYENFFYLDPPKYSMEEAIAISDVCVNMATTSPSTIALICGKNALYFDNTGNRYHPFVKKYKNIIVFEDEELLFGQIKNILDEKVNCKDIISEKELREFDAFVDDGALERLKDNLYELTEGFGMEVSCHKRNKVRCNNG